MIGSHDSFCFDGWVGSHDSSGYWTDNTKKKTVVSWAETQICGFVSAGDNNLRILFGFPWNMYVSK
jgi:hypothetical protein